MGVIGTVRELVAASNPRERGGRTDGHPAGAYWCNDCGERIPAADVVGETPPDCPACGDEMTFERSPDQASCAC